MYDTIEVYSPEISRELADKIEEYCLKYEGVNLLDGEVLFSFTRADLKGSYDYRISVNVERSRFARTYRNQYGMIVESRTPVRVESEPYLKVSCSIHKLMSGHNVLGGPVLFQESMKFLVKFLEKYFFCSLPTYADWIVTRIDVTHCFDLKSLGNVMQYIRAYKNFKYPRRQEPMYYVSCIYFPGSTNTIKMYAKGPEFVKRDYKRMTKHLKYRLDKEFRNSELVHIKSKLSELKQLKEVSMNILRCEIEVKKRKLLDLFADESRENVRVCDIIDSVLVSYYDDEVMKLAKESKVCNLIVRNSDLVKYRLFELFSDSLAKSLLGTWYSLATHGEQYTREMMSKATFHRHIKLLKDNGISWLNSDIHLKGNPEIVDFIPVTSDKHIINGQSLSVKNAMDSLAV